jgi:hypothetical protein
MKRCSKNGAERTDINMERLEFLQRCQIAAAVDYDHKTPNGKAYVLYESAKYFPYEYRIRFDSKGNTKHIAVLKDLHANSVISVRLSEVKEL